MHGKLLITLFVLLLGLATCTTQTGPDQALTQSSDTIRVAAPSGVDDREVLLDALAKANEGSVLLFAPGTYVIGGKISLNTPGLVLVAHPDGTILRGCDPQEFTDPVRAILNCGTLELAAYGQQVRGFIIEYAWHGLLVGCCFPENMEDMESGETFRADQGGGQLIENNHFRYNSTGIRAFGRPGEKVVIRNNTFSDNYHGVTVNGSGVVIRQNRFEADEPSKVPVIGYPDNAVGILSFHSLRPDSAFLDICRENVVEENTIRGLPVGIYITTYEPGESCTDNVIRNNDILMAPVRHGVTVADSDPVIRDINDPLVAGLPIALDNQVESARIERTVITGNRIRNANGLGIQLLRAYGTLVSENEILGVSRRDPFPGNSLRATPWESANGSGIWVSPGSRENTISANVFRDIAGQTVDRSNAPEATITHRQLLADLPSASGMERIGDTLLIIGDDSPFLYVLGKNGRLLDKIRVFNPDTLVANRIPKDIKPDFEAMAIEHRSGHDYIWIFGSGSVSPSRDLMIRMSSTERGESEQYRLSAIYQSLILMAGITPRELNIEGAEIIGEQLYLANRGDNSLYRFRLVEFLEAVLDTTKVLPVPERFSFELPEIQGVKAGISGLAKSADGKSLLFTASVEDTENWIDDGEVLGSFIGIIPLDKLSETQPQTIQVTGFDGPYSGKIESLVVESVDPGEYYTVRAVTDNDDGTSELLKIRLRF